MYFYSELLRICQWCCTWWQWCWDCCWCVRNKVTSLEISHCASAQLFHQLHHISFTSSSPSEAKIISDHPKRLQAAISGQCQSIDVKTSCEWSSGSEAAATANACGQSSVLLADSWQVWPANTPFQFHLPMACWLFQAWFEILICILEPWFVVHRIVYAILIFFVYTFLREVGQHHICIFNWFVLEFRRFCLLRCHDLMNLILCRWRLHHLHCPQRRSSDSLEIIIISSIPPSPHFHHLHHLH